IQTREVHIPRHARRRARDTSREWNVERRHVREHVRACEAGRWKIRVVGDREPIAVAVHVAHRHARIRADLTLYADVRFLNAWASEIGVEAGDEGWRSGRGIRRQRVWIARRAWIGR